MRRKFAARLAALKIRPVLRGDRRRHGSGAKHPGAFAHDALEYTYFTRKLMNAGP